MSENTIKDKKIDKQFFIGVIHTILAFIVNIILGAYVIYVSKILQFIELPTDINKFPYNTNKPQSQPLSHSTDNKYTNINYLYTATDEINDDNTSSSWFSFIPRELMCTKITVDPTKYNEIYGSSGFFSDIYNGKNWVTITYTKLIIQQIYIFYYWGICNFFKLINFDDLSNSGWVPYLWETMIMLIGFPLFILYSIVLTIGLLFYIPYIIVTKLLIIWYYDYKEDNVRKTDDSNSTFFKTIWRGYTSIIIICTLFGISMWGLLLLGITLAGVPFLLPFFIYIFASLIRIPSTIMINKDTSTEPYYITINRIITYIYSLFNKSSSTTGPSYGYNILSFFSVIFAIMSYNSIIPAIIYIIYFIIVDANTINHNNYSISTILLSKIEAITYIIAGIIIYFSSYYDKTILITVCIIFLALLGISSKFKLLFYPYTPPTNDIFIKLTKDMLNNSPNLISCSYPIDIDKIIQTIANKSK